jgi:hypothetical protein
VCKKQVEALKTQKDLLYGVIKPTTTIITNEKRSALSCPPFEDIPDAIQ